LINLKKFKIKKLQKLKNIILFVLLETGLLTIQSLLF